nr:recombinase RecA [Veillonella sp. VA139]
MKSGSQEDRMKALEGALKQIEKDFGQGAIMRMGEAADKMNIEVISTGVLALDLAVGVGGFPRGRIIEIYGPESSGKTTVALHAAAEAQRNGGVVAFIDAEHALDPVYAKKLGVDINSLLISQPDNGEQGLEITEALVRSGAVDLIVVDSVAALTPKVEIDGEMTDAHVGVHARLMSKALRKLTSSISKTRTVIIFINQLREKVGIMFGNPETTTGGRALKFYSTIRLDVRKGEALTAAKEHVGNRTKVKVVKNKVAPPFKVAEFDLMFGEGVSYEGTLIDIGANIEVIKKSGAWYSYNGERMGQGKEAAKVFLKENPQIAQEIDSIIRDTLAAEPLNVLGHDEEVDEVATTETVDME